MSKKSRTRREFITTAAGLGALGAAQALGGKPAIAATIPSYLKGYETQYAANPRQAAIDWFKDAKYGLFMHYGLYSLLKHGEWVQLRELIPVAEYAKLAERFTAEHFDADFITDLALDAEMKYVNITTRHHDSFCLFDTKETDFKVMNTPAKRDLVGELTGQCHKKGLGIFYYYSHGRDWKHPDAPNNDTFGGSARPKYPYTETAYHYGEAHDLQRYVAFMKAQITELLANYGPVSGIWLDGIGTTRTAEDLGVWHCQELYDHIHALQPQVLVSYKQGLLGTEDFFAPERKGGDVENPSGKPLEICDTMQPRVWGYDERDQGKHVTADEVIQKLADAAKIHANLLLNTGPLPDGSIDPGDAATLRAAGKRLRSEGFPKA